MISFTGTPTPLNVASIRAYTRKAKGAKLTARYYVADLSVRAKGLLLDCCKANQLGAPVPNFLELYEDPADGTVVLGRPTMFESGFCLPIQHTKRVIRVDLHPLLTLKKIQTVRGCRLEIPVSAVEIPDWGAALLLHLGALKWVEIRRQVQG